MKFNQLLAIIVGVVAVPLASLFMMFWVSVDRHLAARDAVQSVSGHWSVEPGCPGGHTVSLNTENCGLLPEEDLSKILVAQVHNRDLRYLSVAGQPITNEVARSIRLLDNIETLNLTKSQIATHEAKLIVSSRSLKLVFADLTNAPVLMQAVDEVHTAVSISTRSDP